MITLKIWNSFSDNTRKELCDILGVSPRNAVEYHHNFDYDHTGIKIKWILSQCTMSKDGDISVNVSVKPTFAQVKDTPKKTPKKTQSKEDTSEALKRCVCTKTIADRVKALGGYVVVETNAPWNCNIVAFRLYKSEVYVDIYWQGDTTDGVDRVPYEKIANKEYVIPAETFFDGRRTRETHSDLRITRSMVSEAIEALKKA